jgi:hypothetical protein
MHTLFVRALETGRKVREKTLSSLMKKMKESGKLDIDTEMYCPKGKCGCQYFILLTLKKKIFMDTGALDFF